MARPTAHIILEEDAALKKDTSGQRHLLLVGHTCPAFLELVIQGAVAFTPELAVVRLCARCEKPHKARVQPGGPSGEAVPDEVVSCVSSCMFSGDA